VVGVTLREWLFLFAVGGAWALRQARRAVRRRLRRAVRVGVTGLVAAWAWRQVRAAWRSRPARRPAAVEGDDMFRHCPLSLWARTGCDPACCRWCGARLAPDAPRFCGPQCADPALDNHDFNRARRVRRWMDGYRCVRCGSQRALQVNHMTPVLGRHNVPGCHHHLAGLETLCSGKGSCHQAETNRQRRSGAFGRRAA
jgi:hypothetical protein